MEPRFLYGHGFASSRDSTKGRAIAAHFAALNIDITRLDLRRPSFEHLRLSAMIAHLKERIGTPHDRAVLMGSSLGALTMARVAETDARASALVLLAPAFRLIPRWKARFGAEKWAAWQSSDSLEVDDYSTGKKANVDFGFVEDAERIERGDLPDVRVPTLVLQGSKDDVVDPAHAREFARGKRHVTLVELEDTHELTASIPRICEEIQSFLRNWLVRS
jgi:pimeloyl-ACP methyl ester carboxylesterase